jgi:hypothetical protein
VRQLINVGAKGCFLEDQRWPKKTGHLRNKEVISMDEFAAKVGLIYSTYVGYATRSPRWVPAQGTLVCYRMERCQDAVLSA